MWHCVSTHDQVIQKYAATSSLHAQLKWGYTVTSKTSNGVLNGFLSALAHF